jgi:hypothetical protein
LFQRLKRYALKIVRNTYATPPLNIFKILRASAGARASLAPTATEAGFKASHQLNRLRFTLTAASFS